MTKRPTFGRRKIPIAKLENKNHLQAPFLKKKSGFFQENHVEITIIVFSPTGKVHCFGNPKALSNAQIHELNMQLEYILNKIEEEVKHGKALDEALRTSQSQNIWETPLEDLSIQQLGEQPASLQQLKKNVSVMELEPLKLQGQSLKDHAKPFSDIMSNT
ncbi:hypothetical protein RJ641_023249, partial [Dillenia turbinata]